MGPHVYSCLNDSAIKRERIVRRLSERIDNFVYICPGNYDVLMVHELTKRCLCFFFLQGHTFTVLKNNTQNRI